MSHGYINHKWHFKFYADQQVTVWPHFEVSSGRHTFSLPRVDHDTWHEPSPCGFQSHGDPPRWMVYNGKSQTKMDDLGAPHFRKPPYEQSWMMGYLRYLHIVWQLTWIKQIRDVCTLQRCKEYNQPCGFLKSHKHLAFRKLAWKSNIAVLICICYIYIQPHSFSMYVCIYIYTTYACSRTCIYIYTHSHTHVIHTHIILKGHSFSKLILGVFYVRSRVVVTPWLSAAR